MSIQTHLTAQAGKAELVTFGFWIYIMSDCLLFATLFATYAVQHTAIYGGHTPFDLFSLPFVVAETLLLLTSSFTMGLSLLAVNARKAKLALLGLTFTLLLGAAFLTMEVLEFTELIAEGHGPGTDAFLSSFFALVGTHGAHVAFGALWILVAMVHVAYKGITTGTSRKLACLGLFWHFLDVIWIFIFTFVYLFGFLSL